MKIAIVTGASSGMGREFVKQIEHFYHSLDEIWVIARRKHCLMEFKKTMKTPVRIFEGDLLHRPVYDDLRCMLERKKPDVRMLVNSAGFGKTGTVEEILEEDRTVQLAMIDLNCVALSRMTFICLPYMSEGSRILNLASAAAFCPQPSFTVYAATKSYVLSFSTGLGAELRERNIFVTAVCPGPVDTEFFEVSGTQNNTLKEMVKAKPDKVVKQALLDCLAGKSVSVYSFPMKGAHVASKLIPHPLIVRGMQEKNQKNTSLK